jgi:voltage-gated potassium channel
MLEIIRGTVVAFLSPTRAIMRFRKAHATKAHYAKMIANWNRIFLFVAISSCAATFLLNWLLPTVSRSTGAFALFVFLVGWSRCNETIIAFGGDARDKLRGLTSNPSLPPSVRLEFVVQSYFEIALWFGLVACYLPSYMYRKSIHLDIANAIYFSGVTISTLGYGDFVPSHWVSRFLSLYEVFSGLFLIAIAITIYLSQSLEFAKRDD